MERSMERKTEDLKFISLDKKSVAMILALCLGIPLFLIGVIGIPDHFRWAVVKKDAHELELLIKDSELLEELKKSPAKVYNEGFLKKCADKCKKEDPDTAIRINNLIRSKK